MSSDSEQSVPGGFVEYRFVVPNTRTPATVPEAGLWVQNGDAPSTVIFLGAEGDTLAEVATEGEDFFVGLRAAEGIAVVRVVDEGFYMTDDLQFTMEEPTSVEQTSWGYVKGALR